MIPRLVVCAVAGSAALALPAGASAAPAYDGTSTLSFNKALSTKGIKVAAVAPAQLKGGKLTLPVKDVVVTSTANLAHAGAIKLSKGKRSLTLSAPAIQLAGQSRLRAAVGGTSFAILTVDGRARRLNATAGTAGLKGGAVRLTAAGAALIRTALKVKHLKPMALGRLTVDAKRGSGTGTSGTGGGTGTAGGATTPGGGTTPTPGGGPTTPGGGPAAPACPSATAAGGPAALARTPGAVDLTAATVTWHVRDSFIQYINAGEGTGTCNGASADPPTVRPGSATPLAYDFHFAFKDGWYDPILKVGRATFTGTVTFRYAGHGISLAATNPELEINGGYSRGVFTTSNTGQAPSRGVLETLDLTSGTVANGASPFTYTQLPGRIPQDAGSSVFAGYYAAGDPFGWVTLQMTAP